MEFVEHRIYGRGKIQKKRFGGFELYVEFEDGIRRWVRIDEVRFLSKNPTLTKPKPSGHVLSEEQFKARQIIEALRLGIVPHKYVEEFTFGRGGEMKQIRSWLNGSSKGELAVVGEYGSGKTHLLEYIYSMALRDGWAVSIVEIGQNENPFFRPNQVYQQIIKNFGVYCGDEFCDFRQFVRKLIKNSKSSYLESHIYFKTILSEFKKRESWLYQNLSEETIWEWIEGVENWYKPSLYKTGTAANVYCYILNGISWSLHEILGGKGLLILFDESENVNEVDYKYQIEKGWNFVAGLILLSEDREELLEEKININLEGGKTGLKYCGFPRDSPIRFAWRLPSYLKVIFALTPPGWDIKGIDKIEIDRLSDNAMKNIAKKVKLYYEESYEIQINRITSNELFNKIPRDKTRLFIKGLVEALDLIRFHPDKHVEELLR